MKTERVLHLIDSAGMYGAEKVVLTLLEELLNSKFPGILGCIRESVTEVPQIARAAQDKGIPVQYFTMGRGLNLFGILRIIRFIHNNGIRIVHSHGYKSNIFLGFLPVKKFRVVSTVHGWAKETGGMKIRIYEFLDSFALRRIDQVVAVSKGVINDLIKHGLREEKISVVYNGIKLSIIANSFNISQVRSRYGMTNDDFVIGTVGRLEKVKGHSYLIEAMPSILKEIKHCKLIIVGDGPLEMDLRRLVEKLDLSKYVKFAGYINDIDSFLAMIDLFVLPSLSEGLPITLLEAMDSGKPVLASEVGGIPEVITDNDNGLLFPSADSSSISKAIKNMYQDQSLTKKMSAKGKYIVKEQHSSSSMAKQYSTIYSRLQSEFYE